MSRPPVLVPLVAALALAGCLGAIDPGSPASADVPGPGAGAAPADWPSLALPFGDGHDHADFDAHQDLTTPNFEVLGWSPTASPYHGGETSGGYYCGDVSVGGDRDLAVVHSFTTDVAFVVVDATDPENPEKVGEMVLRNTNARDVAIAGGGTHVVVGTNPGDTGPDDAPVPDPPAETRIVQPVWRDACGNAYQGPAQEVPYAAGVLLVDIADPTAPEVADFSAQPVLGAHSVFAADVGGTEWVLGGSVNGAHAATYHTFYTVEDTPAGPDLVERYTHSAQAPSALSSPADNPVTNGHVDGWIQEHPVTGDTVAYLANWNGGLVVLDLSDGPPYEVLDDWTDFDPAAGGGMTGRWHTAHPIEGTWDGRHYTFIGPELGGRPAERPSGQVVMMDTTDPADIEPVARWTLPTDVDWSGAFQFSTHYVEVDEETRTLFVSMYHGGVWAVDADPGTGPELPSLGVFVPAREPPNPPSIDTLFGWAPTVLDVKALDSGALFVPDGRSGSYFVDFDRNASADVPTPDPWTQDAWIGDGS